MFTFNMRFGRYLLSALLCSPSVTFLHAQDATSTRTAQWRQDISLYARELPARHIDLFFRLSKATFEKEVKALEVNVPNLTDNDITIALMKLTAKIGDAHTRVYPSEAPFARYPFRVDIFSDGWYVIAATPEHKDIVGTRLVKVGEVDVEKAALKVSEVIAAENELWVKANLPEYLVMYEVLRAQGLQPHEAYGSFTFADAQGKCRVVNLKPVPAAERSNVKLLALLDEIHLPLYQQRTQEAYWYEAVPESKTLFLAYNECRNMRDKPFEALVKELFEVVDKNQVERLVVDLRRNRGGDSSIMRPLLEGLQRRPQLTEKGRLFALLRRHTFSSGFLNAWELKTRCNAIWVGEPSSQRPHTHGELQSFVLPNSKLRVYYSTKRFEFATDKTLPFMAVDIAVEGTFKDYVAGRDAVLQAAINHKIAK
jgi:hypothetical protein